MYGHTVGSVRYTFPDLRALLAKATPARSGDALAGVSAVSAEERVAAQMALADLPLSAFLHGAVVPYESDEVTRLILDTHDQGAFGPVAHLTVGGFRAWLLSHEVDAAALEPLAPGLTPEMAAAVSKIMRVQDLVRAGIRGVAPRDGRDGPAEPAVPAGGARASTLGGGLPMTCLESIA